MFVIQIEYYSKYVCQWAEPRGCALRMFPERFEVVSGTTRGFGNRRAFSQRVRELRDFTATVESGVQTSFLISCIVTPVHKACIKT